MIYRGYRAQEQAGIRITKGLFASEGEGVYIALDRDLAMEFSGSGRYLQEMMFYLGEPLVISGELYHLSESPEVEEPVQSSDSVWLKASKLSYQKAMEEANGEWSKASGRVGYYLTKILKGMGYDGVMVDQGEGNRWAVVFNPGKVHLLQEKRQAHLSRETRLAKQLVQLGKTSQS